jgi:predicted DNA-binding transcriptional regulator YafY
VIEPYHLFNVRGDWQVVAFDHRRQGVRQFAVSRIETWTVLRTQRFVRDPDFSVVDYLSTGFLAERGDLSVKIEVWFDAYQARYMRGREFHPSQQIEEHEDGSLTVRLSSGALDEVRRWVMSFGRHAKVIVPASLAVQIAAEATEVARMYNQDENS